MPVVLVVLRVLVAVLGGFLISVALFIEEREEKKFQNALFVWWVKMSDLHGALSISRETAFVKVVTDMAISVFDRLFGKSFWVVPAAPASVAYSTAAFVLSETFIVPLITHKPSVLASIVAVLVAAGLIALGSLGPFIQRLQTSSLLLLEWCLFVLGASGLLLSSYLFSPPGHFVLRTRPYTERLTLAEHFLPIAVLLLSMASDFLFVTFIRKTLIWASTKLSFLRVTIFATGNLLLGLALFAGPFIVGRYATTEKSRSILFLLGSSNAINVLVAAGWFLLAVLMLLHRVLWPVLKRPIYALEKK